MLTLTDWPSCHLRSSTKKPQVKYLFKCVSVLAVSYFQITKTSNLKKLEMIQKLNLSKNETRKIIMRTVLVKRCNMFPEKIKRNKCSHRKILFKKFACHSVCENIMKMKHQIYTWKTAYFGAKP